MMKNLLFKGLMPAVLLLAGVVTANAQTKDAVTITVKDCVYGYQMANSNTTGKFEQTENGKKEVAYLSNSSCLYYLGTFDMSSLFSIELKGVVLSKNASATENPSLRLYSFPENEFNITSDNLNHKSTEQDYTGGINDKVRANNNIFLNLFLSTSIEGQSDPRPYAGANFFVTSKGTALNGAYTNGSVTYSSSQNVIIDSKVGSGNRQIFLSNGNGNGVVLIDQVVFHFKDAATCTYDLVVGDAGCATLCLPYRANIPSGVTCYTLGYTSGENVTATAVTGGVLQPQTPVLVNASEGIYSFTSVKNYSSTSADNALIATWATSTVVPADNYILTMKDGKVGFRKADGTTNKVNAFHCYLKPEAATAREFLGIDFGETSAVEGVQTKEQEAGVVYNLQGVRVENPTKGIYVKNGKKFIVK